MATEFAYAVSNLQHKIHQMEQNTVTANCASGHYEWDDDNNKWDWCPNPDQDEIEQQFESYDLQVSQQQGDVEQNPAAGGNFAATVTEIEERCKNTSIVIRSPDSGETSEAFEAILDTGATWNFISARQLRTLGLAHLLKTDVQFIIKNGQGKEMQAKGYVMLTHAEINAKDNTYITNFNPEPSEFVVMKELSHPCIIGRRESITQILMNYISTLPEHLQEEIQKHHAQLADTPEVVEYGELNVHDDGQKPLSRKRRKALDVAQGDAAKQERAARKALDAERRERVRQGHEGALYDPCYNGYFASDGRYYWR